MTQVTKKRLRAICIATILAAGIAVYFTVDPLDAVWMPKCTFLALTGYSCPGCGSQRAIHSLLHLDFAAAFRANAMLVVSLPLIIFLLWLETARKRHAGLYRRVYSTTFILVCAGSLAVAHEKSLG